ncbi:cadherin-like beta sandwich domain-containing protein [Paenibacillus sp. NPDC056579]|uniref:golvesin C-terminal-like domain-containing protein n=1 Tax=Paenibacillus sp. NPDC056579 TaxID=3345871 RepID=UPI00368401AB
MYSLMVRIRRKTALWLTMLLVVGMLPLQGLWTLDTIVLAAEAEGAIILDNGEAGYSESPSWSASSIKGYNGTATRVTGGVGHTASWKPSLQKGTYRVSFYKVVRPTPSTGDPQMKVEVLHGSAVHTASINATEGTSGWVELGTFAFDGSGNELVRLTRTTTLSGTFTHADAVRFEPVQDAPTAALSGLTVQGAALSPAFDPAQFQYEAQVSASVEAVTLTATASEPSAVIQVNGQTAAGGVPFGPIPLVGAETILTIAVTGNNGISQSYVVRVLRQATTAFVIDFGDYGYTENGSWTGSTTVKGYNQSSTRYTTTQNSSVLYRPNIEAGIANISLYKPDWPDKADPNIRVDIVHNGRTDTVYVDFTKPGAGWLELGTYEFVGDPIHEYVQVTRTAASGSTIYTRVDAVKFEGDIVRKDPPPSALRTRQLNNLTFTEKAAIENADYRVVFYEAAWDGGKTIVKDLFLRRNGDWVPVHGQAERLEEQWVVLSGASGSRLNYYETMTPVWVLPGQIRQMDAQTVELTDTEHADQFDFKVNWSLASQTPQISLEFVPKATGDYVIGYQSFTEEKLETVTEVLSGGRNRAKVVGTVESTGLWELTAPLALVEKPGTNGPLTYGVYIPASELPLRFEPTGTGSNQPVGISLVNNENTVQPILYAPQLGNYSKLTAGQPYRFKLGLYAGEGTIYEAYTSLLREEYGYSNYRQNVKGQSLTDAMFNMIDLLKIDPAGDDTVNYVPSVSGWWSRAKGFIDIENDQAIRTAASSTLMGAYYVTNDGELYDKRALPMLEHGVSRNERGWSPKQKPVYGDPSLWKMASVAFDVTTLSTFYQMTKGYNAGLYQMGQDDFKVRNEGQYARGPVIQPLMMYRMTKDASYLEKAKAAADKYIAEEIDTPATKNGDRNSFFYQYGKLWVEILELYEETRDPKYLAAAHKEAQRYVSIFTVRPVPEGTISIPDPSPFRYYLANNWEDQGKYQYPRAKLPEDESGASMQAEAWMVSPNGLTYEAGNTNSAYRMNAQEAPFLLRLAEYTGDTLMADIAHNAVVGRYSNYPGYYYRGFITSQLDPDFPILGPTEGTSIYYHHAPAQLGQTIDYLITEQMARSNGQISFPSVFETDFLWFKYHVFGAKPGTFYGHPNVWLWMPKGILKSSNPQINWITAESGDKLFISLANEAKSEEQVKLTLNSTMIGFDPTKSYPVTIIRDGGAPETTVLMGGELNVTVSAKGLTAIIVGGMNIQVPLHRAEPEQDTSDASYFFDTHSPMDAVKGMLLVKPDKSSYQAYVQAKTTDPAILHYSLDGGQTYQSSPDAVYPMEWSIRVDELSKTFTYYVESNGKRTRARTLYLPYAVSSVPEQPAYGEQPGVVRVDNVEAELSGTWMRNTAANGYYYDNYIVANTVPGAPAAKVAWIPELQLAGKYRVYINVPVGRSEWSPDATYTVYDAAGTKTYTVDQSASKGRWQLLGTHEFTAGKSGRVELTNTGSKLQVAADAIMLIHESIPDEWSSINIEADKQSLVRFESAQLQVRGTLTTGVDGDLSQATVTYHTYHPELIHIDAAGKLTLKMYNPDIQELEVWAEVVSDDGQKHVTEPVRFSLKELEIILDTSQTGYLETGKWSASGLTGYNKAVKSRYTEEQDATATWTPVLHAGEYEVSFYKIVHTSGNDASVQVEVRYGDRIETRTVNATEAPSGWVSLGRFKFTGSGAEYVKLTRTAPTLPPEVVDRTYTRADAVKFRWVPVEAKLVQPNDPSSASVTDPLVLQFTAPMAPETFTSSTVKVTEAVYGAAVQTTLQWDEASRRLTLTPAVPLSYDTKYAVLLSDEVQSKLGTLLDTHSRSFEFHTAKDETPPVITLTAPERVSPAQTFIASITFADTVSGVVYSSVQLDGMPFTAPYQAAAFSLASGSHELLVRAIDGAGNESVQRHGFMVQLQVRDIGEALNYAYAQGWIQDQGLLQSLLAKQDRVQPLMNELRAQRGKAIQAAFADRMLLDLSAIGQAE